MDKITWCLQKKDGLELIDPNSNLSEAYMKKAESALASMRVVTEKEWIIATAYYTMYLAVYAIMMKIGVKCEIHSCSIEFVKVFLDKYFNEEESDFLKKSLQARIDKQYYIDREVADEQYDTMVKRAPEYLIKAKSILMQISEKEIKEIRNRISNMQKTDKDNEDVEKLFKNAKNIQPKYKYTAKEMKKEIEKEMTKIKK